MNARDEWSAGFQAGNLMHVSRRERAQVLRFVAPLASAQWLDGFLYAYEWTERPPCTCTSCPRHADVAAAHNPNAN